MQWSYGCELRPVEPSQADDIALAAATPLALFAV